MAAETLCHRQAGDPRVLGKTAGAGSRNAGVSGKIDDARQAKAEFDKDGNVMRTTDWKFDFSAAVSL